MRQADDLERGGDMRLALAFRQMREQQRQLGVALGVECGEQIVELENEADVPRAPGGALTSV